MHNEKKRHNSKERKYFKPPTEREFDETFYAYNEPQAKSKKDDEEEEKINQIYKLFYAELMKLFVIESGSLKPVNVIEPDLDQKLLNASGEFYSMHNDMYEVIK